MGRRPAWENPKPKKLRRKKLPYPPDRVDKDDWHENFKLKGSK